MKASSHFDDHGNAHMVDVTQKSPSVRVAIATGEVLMLAETADQIRAGGAKKGDVLGVARLAGIQAAKWTPMLIPLCHAITVESVSIEFSWPESDVLRCTARVQTTGKTGVEMEAMTAVSIACLTVYDMVKGIDRAITIGSIRLMDKSGGKSGRFERET